jgi:hypothetical protein
MFNILTKETVARIVRALNPRFMGRDQDHLLELADATAEAAYDAAFDIIEPIQDFIVDIQSPAGAELVGIDDPGGVFVGDTVQDALFELIPLDQKAAADGVATLDSTGTIPFDQVAFIQTGTGAVKREAVDKMRDVVSVLDFGVTGNGITDDLSAIKLAIENRKTGTALMFPAGDYFLVGNLDTTLTSPLTMILDPSARIVGDNSDVPMFTIRGGASRHGLTVSGGILDNGDRIFSGATQSGTALSLVGIDDLYVENTVFGRKTRDWVDGFGDAGLTTDKCQRMTITGCTFYGQPDLGIYATGGASTGASDDYTDMVVTGNRFHRCNLGVSSKRQFRNSVVTGNTFFECRGGVALFEAGGIDPARLAVVSNNTFKFMQDPMQLNVLSQTTLSRILDLIEVLLVGLVEEFV